MMWKRRKNKINEQIERFKYEHFDDFLFGEVFDFLNTVQPLINASNSNAETLASVDSMMIGIRHAVVGELGEACFCCKYWCSGANCMIVQDSWLLFLEKLPELKILIKNA